VPWLSQVGCHILRKAEVSDSPIVDQAAGFRPRVLDLFCGAGGSSLGATAAGAEVVGGIDSSLDALLAYRGFFPSAATWWSKAEALEPSVIARALGRVDLLLASPDCTNHTCAKGAARRSESSRMTAFQVARYARVLRPRWIVIENVIHMRPWNRYSMLLGELREEMGYHVSEQVLNAADFGLPQNRRRLFILCDAEARPEPVLPSSTISPRSAKSVVDFGAKHQWTPLHSRRRAKPTLARARRAIASVGRNRPFLIVYYGTDGCGGWQPLTKPLRTVTTVDRFAIVRPTSEGHEMRMLQVPELAMAMGFPPRIDDLDSSRRTRIRLLGNGVCPPVMEAIISGLTKAG
jgi:DNA (cytosine-5)-methyltransferase 1